MAALAVCSGWVIVPPLVVHATSTYAAAVEANAPAFYYRLDESSGSTMSDSSGAGRNATYQGGVGFGASSALANESDAAVAPNGNTAGIYSSGAGEPTGAAARTVEGWIRTIDAANQDLVSWGTGTGQGFGMMVGYSGAAIGAVTDNNDHWFTTPRRINDGNWHMFDVTYDGNVTVTAYMDGQSLGSQQWGSPLNTVQGTLDVGGTAWLNGGDQIRNTNNGLDEIAVYPAALTATQIAATFTASGDTRPTAPVVSATAGMNQATVSWSASTASVPTDETAVQSYVVTAYLGSSPKTSEAVPGTSTSLTMTGLVGGSAYTFQVTGTNAFGVGSAGTSNAVTPTGASSTYASTVLADGPAFYYRLDDTGGSSMIDSSGSRRDAQYGGGLTWGIPGATPSDGDGAVAPNGNTAGWYASGTAEPIGSAARTVEGWIRTVDTNNQDLVSWGTGTGQGFGMMVGYSGAAIGAVTDNNDLWFSTPRAINDGNWHLFDVAYDGNVTGTAYIDGTALGTQQWSSSLNTVQGQLDIGGTAWLNGGDQIRNTNNGLDEVAIYPSALSATQVANHYRASGDTLQSAPGTPVGVSATGGNSQATVNWSPPAFDGGSAITGYTITPYIGSTAQTSYPAGPSDRTITINNLTNGTVYTFQVTATNAIGTSRPTTSNSVAPAVAPGPPTAVQATASDGRAQVSWTAPGAPNNTVSSYTVTPFIGTVAQTALAVTVTAPLGTPVATATSVGGLTDGTTYTFQVFATNGAGSGPAASSGPVVPAPPAPLTLAPAAGYSAGAAPQHVVVGDANGDGWPDLVTPNGGSNSLSTLLNNVTGAGKAGGSFGQPAIQSSLGVGASQIALGDFNGDGKLDAAIVNGTGTIGVALGTGGGTFGAESAAQTMANQNIHTVAVADVNGDGKPDIVAAGVSGQDTYWSTAIYIMLGNGDGTFQPMVRDLVGDQCLGCSPTDTGIALADVNGDGLPDIIYTSNSTSSGSDAGNVYAFLNQGGGAFNVSNRPVASGTPGLHSAVAGETIAVADLNGDNHPDIITVEDGTYVSINGTGGQRGISILFGKGDGTFLAPVYVRDPALTDGASPPNDAGDVEGIAIADMNGDHLPDIVAADSNSFSGKGGLSVYLDAGGGSIDSPTFIPTSNFAPKGLALADVNKDGEADVVLENNQGTSPNILVLINGTDFPPLGGPLGPNEVHGCAMCQAMRGGGALDVSGSHPITVNSGEMSHTFTDVSIPARGFPISVTQTYNDLNAATDAGLGYGWWSPLFMSVTQNATTGITSVTQENGGQAQFWTSSLLPVAPRTQATLVHNGDGTWTFTRYGSTTLSFNSSGQITSISDLTGNRLTFGYTGSQVTTVTHSDGRKLTIAWTSGHISTITDGNVSTATRTVSFTYDASSQLTDIDWKVKNANDRNEHFEYETTPWNHGMTGMRDPRGIWVTQVYDASGHTTSQTVDPTSKNPSGLNRTTTYSYTFAGGAIAQVLITDPMNNQQQDTFAYGELVQTIKAYGTASAATWTYTYDPSSVGTTETIDPNGHLSSASFDVYGNPQATTDPLGRTTAYTYTGNGGTDGQYNQPTTMMDPNGVTTSYTYDPTHRTLTQTATPLVGSSPAVSQVVQYQHTNASHPDDITAMIDGDGKTWAYGYDTYGDRTSVTDPLNEKSSTTYNADGWVLTTVTPKNYTTTYSQADASGNINFWGAVTTTTDPLNHKTVNVYDNDNNVISFTDADSKVTTYDFDDANEQTVTHRADAGHTTVKTDYNADGSVHGQIDGKGNTVQVYTYNGLGQQVAVTADPGASPHLNATTTYSYDGTGNLLTKQAPGGSCTGTVSGCTTYTYDPANQLTNITYSDGTTPNVSNVQYDGDGQRTGQTDGSGTWVWQFDSLHRLTSVTEGPNGTVSYGYNLRNEPTTITYPGSVGVLTRGYDNAGRWTSVQDWNGASTSFGYDANSNLTTETMPATGNTVIDTFGFNNADQLTSITTKHGSTSLFSATYTRDGNAQVTSDTSATTNQTKYGYSDLNQVCYAGSANSAACTSPPSGSQPFAYDAADNLITIGSTTQVFNTADQVTSSGTTTYQYDSHGNRTTTMVGSAVTDDGYDQADRLCWSGPTSSGAGCTAGAQTSDTVYCYNGDGVRMLKVTAGSCGAPTTSETFTWDVSASLPLALTDGSTDYVYGPGGLPLEQINGSTTLWYHHDQIGSTRAITDASGAVKATYTLDPYGSVTSCTGATVNVGGMNKCTGTITVSNPFLFTGQYRDAETNSYYLRARYYDPSTAQFLTRDPMVATTRSPYGYVSGNPLNNVDPSGECGLWGSDTCWDDAAGWVNDNVVQPAAQTATTAWNDTGGQVVNFLQTGTIGLCVSGSIYGGIGYEGSACIVESHGFQHMGLTFTGGAGLGLGASVSGGLEFSNASCPNDLGGPFAGGGGGFGPVSGGVQFGQGSKGQLIGAGYIGAGLSTPEGYINATRTAVWQWW